MSRPQTTLVRWMKFNAVGAIGICLQLSVLALLRSGLGWNYLLSTALAVEITVVHNFLWHERFTWADRRMRSTLDRFARFNLTTGIFSVAGNIFFTKLLVDSGIGYLAANGVAIAACSIVNFFLNDYVIFVVSPSQSIDRSGSSCAVIQQSKSRDRVFPELTCHQRRKYLRGKQQEGDTGP